MTESSKVSRRSILKAGAGIAASAVSATAMAKSTVLTPANPDGPDFQGWSMVKTDAEGRDLLTVDFHEADGVQHGHFPIVLAKVV